MVEIFSTYGLKDKIGVLKKLRTAFETVLSVVSLGAGPRGGANGEKRRKIGDRQWIE